VAFVDADFAVFGAVIPDQEDGTGEDFLIDARAAFGGGLRLGCKTSGYYDCSPWFGRTARLCTLARSASLARTSDVSSAGLKSSQVALSPRGAAGAALGSCCAYIRNYNAFRKG
jgi:hypothetical protein